MTSRSGRPAARIACVMLVLASLLAATSANAKVSLRSGFTTVEISPGKVWSFERVVHRGIQLLGAPSSNGVVLQYQDGTWSGEGHGRETLESVSLMIDGAPATLQDGRSYSGTLLVLTRAVLLDGSVRLRHVLTVSPDGVDQWFALEGLDPDRSVSRAYVSGESRSNRFSKVDLFRGEERLDSSSTDRNDRTFYRPPAGSTADRIVQSDPNLGDGVETRWNDGGAPGLEVWVWDRSGDNKLYLVATGYTDAGQTLALQQSIRVCLPGACPP